MPKLEDKESNQDEQDRPITLTRSYCPSKPPSFTEEEEAKFADGMRRVRTDYKNLRPDPVRNMLFFSPDVVEDNNNGKESWCKRWCVIL